VGGFYREVLEVKDGKGQIERYELGMVLTVDEAVSWRGSVRIFFRAKVETT
jgi:hypothetical protein